jgi:hypothetical protein
VAFVDWRERKSITLTPVKKKTQIGLDLNVSPHLSLGEWCMAADFDAIIFLLQHSPNI